MFVQVMEGKVADPDRLRRQGERWASELQPGSIGFLGTTVGVSDDGRAVILARFESAEAAARNSERPEQGAWWAETERCFDGPVTFHDSSDVEVVLNGADPSAEFVQVMKYSVNDRERVQEIDRRFSERMPELRPDVLGSLRVWTSPDRCIDAVFFTSEADARENEAKPMPEDVQAEWSDMEGAMGEVEFIDLREPWHHTV